MNNHLDQLKKSKPNYFFLVILIIAIGIHLLILFSFLKMPRVINTPKASVSQKAPLRIQLIYKTKQPESNNSFSNKESISSKSSGEIRLNLTPLQTQAVTPLETRLPNSSELSPSESENELIPNSLFKRHPSSQQARLKKTNNEMASSLSQSLQSTQQESFVIASDKTVTSGKELENVFSSLTKKQLVDAKEAQKQYEEAQVEEINYAITEDSDGTRYVNIKGVCWRIPPPGSEAAWTIVYAGCSGQTKTFNIEINIGMDILGPDSPLAID